LLVHKFIIEPKDGGTESADNKAKKENSTVANAIVHSLVDFYSSLQTIQSVLDDVSGFQTDECDASKCSNEIKEDDDVGTLEAMATEYQLVVDVINRSMYFLAVPWLPCPVFICSNILCDALIALAATVRTESQQNMLYPAIHSGPSRSRICYTLPFTRFGHHL